MHEQVTFAAKKAMISGRLRAGDSFPSVRVLSKALKINPNTAHKVVAQLTQEGLLEVRPGVGTIVAERIPALRAERERLLGRELEHLAVEAKRLGLTLAGLERMFFETGVPLAEGATTALPPSPEEIGKLLAVAPGYGIEIRPPGA